MVNEAYCPNQCNGGWVFLHCSRGLASHSLELRVCAGHGECRLGFCYCHKGWFGHDCAYRTADTPWTPGKATRCRLLLRQYRADEIVFREVQAWKKLTARG